MNGSLKASMCNSTPTNPLRNSYLTLRGKALNLLSQYRKYSISLWKKLTVLEPNLVDSVAFGFLGLSLGIFAFTCLSGCSGAMKASYRSSRYDKGYLKGYETASRYRFEKDKLTSYRIGYLDGVRSAFRLQYSIDKIESLYKGKAIKQNVPGVITLPYSSGNDMKSLEMK